MNGDGLATPADLAGLLGQKLALLAELQLVLEQETAALVEGQQAAIVGLAEEKQGLALGLRDLAQVLNNLLAGQGYSQDAEGFARCVRDAPDTARLTALYDDAMRALRECAIRNQTNYGLVERRRSAVERALRLFFDRPGETARYHASGRMEGVTPNRLIGEA